MPFFSIIVPVYNRPDETRELLESLSLQSEKDFETIIVEDGSAVPCRDAAERYAASANVRYFFKPNEGRSAARNYGMERAAGEWLVFFDSDCIIPPDYFKTVKARIADAEFDCYGGPDAADASFTTLQKAINYSMTSFFTTGGIRGRKGGMEKFLPRTFNMGFKRKVFDIVGGFRDMFGEDIDMSLRIRENGFCTVLLTDAFVFHKRRNTLGSFSRQMIIFGRSRIELYLLHPDSLKIVHLLPAAFMCGSILLMLLAVVWSPWFLLPLGIYYAALVCEAAVKNRSAKVASLAPVTATIQLWGYACGFLRAFIMEVVFKRKGDKEAEMRRLKFK